VSCEETRTGQKSQLIRHRKLCLHEPNVVFVFQVN